MKKAGLIAIVLIFAFSGMGSADYDPETNTITNERWLSGVPLGGIGCGKIEALTDGWLGYYSGNHNWDRPTGRMRGAFFALFCDSGDEKTARMLRLASPGEYTNVENVTNVSYNGLFPVAKIDYGNAGPVNVKCKAWSPLVAGNSKDSSLPVAVFDFAVTNNGDCPVDISLACAFENLVGWGGRVSKPQNDLSGNRASVLSSDAGYTGLKLHTSKPEKGMPEVIGEYVVATDSPEQDSVSFSSFDPTEKTFSVWSDFASDGLADKSISCDTDSPANIVARHKTIPANESVDIRYILVWHFPDHITRDQTFVPLEGHTTTGENAKNAVDGDGKTRWDTGRRMVPGDKFEVDMGRVETVEKIIFDNSTGSQLDFARGYEIETSVDGKNWQVAASAGYEEAENTADLGVLKARFASPVEARYIRMTQTGEEFRFFSIHELYAVRPDGEKIDRSEWQVTGYTKNTKEVTDEKNVGHYYSNYFSSAEEILTYVDKCSDRLIEDTKKWQRPVMDSNMPMWLKVKLINSAFSVYTCGILTKSGDYYTQEAPVDMHGACGTNDQRMASHAFWTQMFPELDESELRAFAKCQDMVVPVADGRIPHFNGNLYYVLGSPVVGYGITDWPDLSCSFVMQVLKHARWTGDKKFLRDMYPHCKRALSWLATADRDGDLICEGGSTYDYEQLPRGAFCYNASCYLGALKAGRELALHMNDPEQAAEYESLFQRVQEAVIRTLWNGKYFVKDVQPGGDVRNDNCFIAQLAGDWLSRLCASGRTFGPNITDSAISEVIKRNVNSFHPVPPMEVTPDGEVGAGGAYLLQHEPYAGCEAIYEGYVDNGLDVIKRIYIASYEKNFNPWQQCLAHAAPGGEQLGLQNYMTAPTTWHVLNALTGVTLDAFSNTLYISPKIGSTMPELHMPVYMSKVWLWVDYVPGTSLKVRVMEHFGEPIEIKHVRADAESTPITLEKPFVMKKGKKCNLTEHMDDLVVYKTPKFISEEVAGKKTSREGIPSDLWIGYVEYAGDDYRPKESIYHAYDGRPETRWTTGRAMKPGDSIFLDFASEYEIDRVVLDSKGSPDDYPRGVVLFTGTDADNMQKIVELSKDECAAAVDAGVLEIEFDKTKARYIMLKQTGDYPTRFWSVHEVYVFSD